MCVQLLKSNLSIEVQQSEQDEAPLVFFLSSFSQWYIFYFFFFSKHVAHGNSFEN